MFSVKLDPENPFELLNKAFGNSLTKSNLLKNCIICGLPDVEMHHVRSVKNIRHKYTDKDSNFASYKGAFLRKQIPLCSKHHKLLHTGKLSESEVNLVARFK
jgi:hypothetical protein